MTSAPRLLALPLLFLACLCPATLRAQAPFCGDNVLDLGEACDEGSANGAFVSCCTAECELRSAGGPCRAAAGSCDPAEACDGATATCPADVILPDADGDEACDDQDVCPAVADPGQEDGDGDGRGDACDPCTAVAGAGVEKAVLKITKLLTPEGDDRLKLKATLTAVPSTPTLDAVVNGLRFILSDALGDSIIDARIPGGQYSVGVKAGWKGSTTGWSYANGGQVLPLIQGLTKISVKGRASQPGRFAVAVVGKRGSYAVGMAGLPLLATVILDPPLATTGQCVEVGFAPANCVLSSNGAVTCK